MLNYDLVTKYGWQVELYNATLSDNVQTTLGTGITTRRPVAVLIVEAVYPSTGGFQDYLESMAWDVDANLKPRVTPQFSNNVTNVSCVVAVCYKR